MKIKPALHNQEMQSNTQKQSLNCNYFHTNNKGSSGTSERRGLDIEQKNAVHLGWS
jgi:hypothetical protein